MTPLANEIYRQLRRRLRSKDKSITYKELAEETSKKVPTHFRHNTFYRALSEVTAACRELDVPALPAIVWKSGGTHPGDGYYDIAHPREPADGRLAAWQNEYDAVLASADNYPPSL